MLNYSHLAVTLCSWALAHVYATRLEVELWRHSGVTRGEQTALDGAAVLV